MSDAGSATVAGLDIGSNTVRLLLARVAGRELHQLLRLQGITRLGGGFDPDVGLSPAAIERTVVCLEQIRTELDTEKLPPHVALATSAVRRAANAGQFIDQVLRRTGFILEVIDGALEAQLTARGVRSNLSPVEPFWLIDVGGGSTELGLWGSDEGRARSVELGCISLLDAELHDDPPSRAQLESAAQAAGRAMAQIVRELNGEHDAAGGALVAVAGTPTTLAAMELGLREYRAELVHGSSLSRGSLLRLLDLLASMNAEQRSMLPGMEHGREDLIIPGILLLLGALDALGLDQLTVSDAGLLEGAALLAADRRFGVDQRRFVTGGRLTIL
ncbi:MAG: hypothetical protein P9M14_17320 [Candidatus Alcyoniella australis]|nr:hypothetical protein [Candidatus Alcyoniella australis]